MNTKRNGHILNVGLVSFFMLCLTVSVFGQGRGRGGGGGGGRGSGGGVGGGPPAGVGVDRGLGNASDRSNGRSDDGLRTASERSKGRSDAGLERARMASSRLRDADRDLRDHPGIANTLHVNANQLRAGYQAALVNNPDLKFGQYVAATRVAQNLGSRFPNITRDAILEGLASGESLGSTLRSLGLSSDEANAAKKRAEREIKQARK
ncbi:MAG TPA: hypothetical protein VEW46_12225 [Pyrinomonadaceae bacterium]|nr:hypothetical protein [Pyrinomonadaceae bacterium]